MMGNDEWVDLRSDLREGLREARAELKESSLWWIQRRYMWPQKFEELRDELTEKADRVIRVLPEPLAAQYAMRSSARRLVATRIRYERRHERATNVESGFVGAVIIAAASWSVVLFGWYSIAVIVGMFLVTIAVEQAGFGDPVTVPIAIVAIAAVTGSARYYFNVTEQQIYDLTTAPILLGDKSQVGWTNWWVLIIWSCVLLLLFGIATSIFTYFKARSDRYLRQRSGIEACLLNLTYAYEVLSAPMAGSQLRKRRKFVEFINKAADELPDSWIASDLRAGALEKEVLSREWSGISRGFRTYGERVAMAKADTVDETLAAIRANVASILRGQFGDLPRAELETVSRAARIATFFNNLRSLVAGLTPAAVVGVLAYFHVAIPDEFRSTLILIAVIWAAITILSMLDPGFDKKLESSQKLFSTLRGGGGGG